jgi:hypothetical protein
MHQSAPNPATMDRTAAVRFLHARHPNVIPPVEGEVDLERLHLDFFWLQSHLCERLEGRTKWGAKRVLRTVCRAFVDGDPQVRDAVRESFFLPELVLHEEAEWAMRRMPKALAHEFRRFGADFTAMLERAEISAEASLRRSSAPGD